jgi:hypothetical protein
MPIQGLTRFRQHQWGKQSSFASNTVATRRMPWRGAIEVDPARTDPDVDVGSLDPILAPFLGPQTVTASLDITALSYNDAPYYWGALLKEPAITGGGANKTHTIQAASLTADDFLYITDYWGDDVASDYIIGGSGVGDSGEIGFGDDLGVWTGSLDMIYARAQLGTGPTGGIVIDDTPEWIYGAHTEVFLDTAFGSIGTTKLTDSVHGATVRVTNNLDQKRFANGSNSAFQLAGYGRGPREIEVELVLAKTTATVAEFVTLDDTPVPERFIELRTTSPETINGANYSQVIRTSGHLISRSDGELGGNSIVTLTYRAHYDADLGYAIRVVLVNGLASL